MQNNNGLRKFEFYNRESEKGKTNPPPKPNGNDMPPVSTDVE